MAAATAAFADSRRLVVASKQRAFISVFFATFQLRRRFRILLRIALFAISLFSFSLFSQAEMRQAICQPPAAFPARPLPLSASHFTSAFRRRVSPFSLFARLRRRHYCRLIFHAAAAAIIAQTHESAAIFSANRE
jgi:hypothetical protein